MTTTRLEVQDTPVTIPTNSSPARRPLRICMVVYAFYESDTRVLQYATALAKRGDIVDVLALKRDDSKPEVEVINGVTLYRIQSRTVNEKGLMAYASRIMRFLLRSTMLMRRMEKKHSYDAVHIHNVPDFLVFSALFPKWKRVPVILDIHDLLPELYASKFKISHNSLLFKLLVFAERCSAAFATHVIVANHLWRDRLAARSSHLEKCSVVRNHPDLDIFVALSGKARKQNERFLMIYPGTLNGHQGLDVAIRAFASVADQIPDADFHIYGEGPVKQALAELAGELKMQGRIFLHDFLPSHEIAQIMATADLAIEPKRSTSAFGNEALSTKILEFMALRVPVIASKTQIHAYYYDDSLIQYYENDNESELARQMVRLKNDPQLRARLVANAEIYAQKHNWDAQKAGYLQLIDSLVASRTRNKVH